jgi:hypothetical protein
MIDLMKILEKSLTMPRNTIYEAFDTTKEEWFELVEEIKKEYPNLDELFEKFPIEKVIRVVSNSDTYSEAISILLIKMGKRYVSLKEVVMTHMVIWKVQQEMDEAFSRFTEYLKEREKQIGTIYG